MSTLLVAWISHPRVEEGSIAGAMQNRKLALKYCSADPIIFEILPCLKNKRRLSPVESLLCLPEVLKAPQYQEIPWRYLHSRLLLLLLPMLFYQWYTLRYSHSI